MCNIKSISTTFYGEKKQSFVVQNLTFKHQFGHLTLINEAITIFAGSEWFDEIQHWLVKNEVLIGD